jgi:hypothetical protein
LPRHRAVKQWTTQWQELWPELQLPVQTRRATAYQVCEMFWKYRAQHGGFPAPSSAGLGQRQRWSLHFSPCQIGPDSILLPMIGQVPFSKRWRVFGEGRSIVSDGVHVWRSPTTGVWHATPKFRRTSLGR